MKVAVFSVGGKFGGGISHAKHAAEAMRRVGLDAKVVSYSDIGDPDIIFMDSIGITGEKGKGAAGNEKRLDKLMRYWGKVPFVAVRRGVTESVIFKQSFEFFRDKVWDLMVAGDSSKEVMELIEKEHKFKKLVAIGRAFDFKDEYFEDKSEYGDVIVSPSRFACCKHNNTILDIAKILRGERVFLMAGYEKGIYWYRAIKEHSNRGCAAFIGGYDDFVVPYSCSAFGIDLTYIQRGKYVNRGHRQHTQIETIACGNIPIVYDVWNYPPTFEAVWLPSPKKEGRKRVYHVEECADIIRGSKYDFDMAVRNRELLKEMLDMEKVGNQYKAEFEELLR